MQNKKLQKIITILAIIAIIIISSTNSFAGITPDQITGEHEGTEIDLTFTEDITELIGVIGRFLAVGVMMVIGIKYVVGSVEEKANYKKSMMPYIIGCFILFASSTLAPQILEIFTDLGEDTEDIGNNILGIIQAVGTILAVGVLMILGIKYMMGTIEERASYKKSMLPYAIGVVLIFAGVNLTSMIYDIATFEHSTKTGKEAANSFTATLIDYEEYQTLSDSEKDKIKETISKEYEEAVIKRDTEKEIDPESGEYEYWRAYATTLKKALDSL